MQMDWSQVSHGYFTHPENFNQNSSKLPSEFPLPKFDFPPAEKDLSTDGKFCLYI